MLASSFGPPVVTSLSQLGATFIFGLSNLLGVWIIDTSRKGGMPHEDQSTN